MRSIPANLNTELIKQYGVEVITVIEATWNPTGNPILYADRDTSFADGKIIQLSPLDFVVNVDGGSDSAEISITLDDTNGEIKNILDQIDVHKQKVAVYQYVDGTSYPADRGLVFSGQISSPLTWREGDRTVSFTVLSQIEDAEIGLSLEEGQFQNLDPQLIGTPLPLKFGSTTRVPAVRLESILKGTLATPVGIKDPTLNYRLQEAEELSCPTVFNGYYARYNIFGSLLLTPLYIEEPGCVAARCTEITNLTTQVSEQGALEYDSLTIIGGENFPQNTYITLNINGGKFSGTMDGDVFTIQDREHPDADTLLPLNDAAVDAICETRRENLVLCGSTIAYDASGAIIDGQTGVATLGDTPQQKWERYRCIPTGSFFWANAGSTVTLDDGDSVVYVSNIITETIHQVQAFRQFESTRKLVAVPSDWYTTRSTDYNTYDVSEIVMSRPLSSRDESWSDDIYVNSTSTVGPNTVDIMEWLIDKYTNLTYDATSFDYVNTRLEEYPSDFPILERRNILDVLREIAFQARCAIYLRDGVFYLKYLPELPTNLQTITNSDTDAESLEIFHTDTEDLVTKLVAEWQWDYSVDEPNKLILRHNVQKYGTQEDTFSFYIYHELDYVHKSATFWMIRKSNTWKMLRFSTPLHLFKLETFDGVDIDISSLSDDAIRSLITKADYDSNDLSLNFEVWTPVRAGTTEAYDFAYPADIAEETEWPTQDDRTEGNIGSGDAPGFSAEVTSVGHPLLNGYQQGISGASFGPCPSQSGDFVSSVSYRASFDDQTCGGGNGDTYPSDNGDAKKIRSDEDGSAPNAPSVDTSQINTKINTDGTVGTSRVELQEERLDNLEQAAYSAMSEATDANDNAGGSSANNPFEELPTEDAYEGDCKHRVQVLTWFFTSVIPGPGLPRTTAEGTTGQPTTGNVAYAENFIFACYCEALEFASKGNAKADSDYDSYNIPNKELYQYQFFLQRDTSTECVEAGSCPGGESGSLGQAPTPVAYSQDVTDETTTEEQGGVANPEDWWDELGLEEC